MFRVVGFFVCVFAILVAGDEDLSEQCHTFKHNIMKCCTNPSEDQRFKTKSKAEIKECLPEHPSLSCEGDICIAKKLGYYGSDEKVDMEAVTNFIEKDLQENQELLGLILNNCLKAEPTGVCGYRQIHRCMLKQSIENCHEWSSEGDCNENKIKEFTKVCLDNN